MSSASRCKNKTVWPSKKRAKLAKQKAEKIAGRKLYIYKCHRCDGYHLTKMRRDEYRKKAEAICLGCGRNITDEVQMLTRGVHCEQCYWRLINKENDSRVDRVQAGR